MSSKELEVEWGNAGAKVVMPARIDVQSFRFGMNTMLDFIKQMGAERAATLLDNEPIVRLMRGPHNDLPTAQEGPLVKGHLALVTCNGRTL